VIATARPTTSTKIASAMRMSKRNTMSCTTMLALWAHTAPCPTIAPPLMIHPWSPSCSTPLNPWTTTTSLTRMQQVLASPSKHIPTWKAMMMIVTTLKKWQ
jgi:hypothetical protein